MRCRTEALGVVRLLGAAGLLAILAAACSSDSPPPWTFAPARSSPEAVSDSPGPMPAVTPIPARDATVRIVDYAFDPDRLSVGVGATVTFRNDGADVHTVRWQDDGSESARLSTGATTSRTFAEPGTFAFLCGIHPTMEGSIVVAADAQPSSGPAASDAAPQPSNPASPAPSPSVAAGAVDIVDYAFRPTTLSVRVGSTVTFRNRGLDIHTVKWSDSESPRLGQGSTYRRIFRSTGRYPYLCGIHPSMKGEVVVVAAAAPLPTPPPPPPQPSPTPGTSIPPSSAPGSVAIVDFAFDPIGLTVNAGATVTWVNNGSARHTVKFGTFESPELATGQSYQRTFAVAGTFGYVCGLHSRMSGTITVTAPSGPGPPGGGGTPTPEPTLDPAAVALARIVQYHSALTAAVDAGFYVDREQNLRQLADRVREEVQAGDGDAARSKAADLLEETQRVVSEGPAGSRGDALLGAAEAVADAVQPL